MAVAETHTIDFVMPSLGADMERGRVGQWRLAVGAPITRGQVIVDVDTDKGLIDVECFHDGVLREIVVPEGREVPVGAVIARIEVDDDKVRIISEKAALSDIIAGRQTGAASVRGFTRKWRARKDSNL